MNQKAAMRTETRQAIEQLQNRKAELEGRHRQLLSGCAAEDLGAQRQMWETRTVVLAEHQRSLRERIEQNKAGLAAARATEVEEAAHAAAIAEQLGSEEAVASEQAAARAAATSKEAVAVKRLQGMVAAGEVQRREAEAKEHREALRAIERETRQLRGVLAEALSSGADLPNALRELEVLRESADLAARRVRGLEEVNEQLQGRIDQLDRQVSHLRKGTVDLRSEEDLMREVLVQQTETLVRRVEDLTDERATANADRQQLLATAADILSQVDSAEARLKSRTDLERQANQLELSVQALEGEVERLRGSNGALLQQVLGEEGEGPLGGTLGVLMRLPADDVGEALRNDFERLVRGQRPPHLQGGLRGEATALALRLQQILAEREEAFWVERQRLSDRLLALERTRPGRASGALREYDAIARGGSWSGASVPTAAASAVTGGLRKLRESIGA